MWRPPTLQPCMLPCRAEEGGQGACPLAAGGPLCLAGWGCLLCPPFPPTTACWWALAAATPFLASPTQLAWGGQPGLAMTAAAALGQGGGLQRWALWGPSPAQGPSLALPPSCPWLWLGRGAMAGRTGLGALPQQMAAPPTLPPRAMAAATPPRASLAPLAALLEGGERLAVGGPLRRPPPFPTLLAGAGSSRCPVGWWLVDRAMGVGGQVGGGPLEGEVAAGECQRASRQRIHSIPL